MTAPSYLDPADRIAIEDLLTDLSLAVDDREPQRLSTLVTEDVSFDVGHGPILGRGAVVEGFSARASDLSFVARHLWSNLKIVAVDGDTVRLRCAFATFAVTDLDGARSRIWRCGDYHDVVRKGADGRWLLAERRLDLALPD